MVEENGVPRRLRDLEMKVAGHIAECVEKGKRMQDHFDRNNLDHQHLNDHLDNIDNKMDGMARNVALITGGIVVVGTLVSVFFK